MSLNEDNSKYWALYNGDVLWCVERTKMQCKMYASQLTGKDFDDVKDSLQFRKVKLHIVDKT